MKTLVRIIAQYSENVAFGEGGECWKPKSGREFEVEIDDNLLMFDNERCKAAIINMLAKHNNKLSRFELIDFEPVFYKPVQLCTADDFENEVIRLYKAEPVDHDEDRATQEQIDMLRDN